MNLKFVSDVRVMTGLLALSVASVPAWADGAPDVSSPGAGTTTVARTDAEGHQSPIAYSVVHDSADKVKFENATVGLGESGAIESDLFVIDVANAGDTIRVETKAGRDTAEWVSGESDSDVDANGFQIELVDISDGTYILRVSTTAAVDSALSNVTFQFFPGQQADAAYD